MTRSPETAILVPSGETASVQAGLEMILSMTKFMTFSSFYVSFGSPWNGLQGELPLPTGHMQLFHGYLEECVINAYKKGANIYSLVFRCLRGKKILAG